MNEFVDKVLSEPILIVLCGIFVLLIVVLIILIIKYVKNKKIIEANLAASKEIPVVEIKEKNNSKSEIELLLDKMENDLKAVEEEEKKEIETFEEEQEEKAIISYQELLAANQKKMVTNEINNSNNDKHDSISNTEKTDSKTSEIEKLEFDIKPDTDKKFKTTEFISPVYGILNSKSQYPTINNKLEIVNDSKDNNELEKTLNIEPLSKEIKKNDEFLKALKEFRKNL